ncbi:MAG: inner membrane protein YhjD [Mycobacteriaceae bacterium]
MTTGEDTPGFLDRQRQARPWLDHLVRAGLRYKGQKGDYYAAAITYFSVLALIPLLMVGFSIAAFVLAGHPALLVHLQQNISKGIPGSTGATINEFITKSLASRGTVGVIGLAAALYAGLGWMANLREALTAQWDQQHERGSFLATKLADLAALAGLGLALVVSLALSVVGGWGSGFVLDMLGLDQLSGAFVLTAVLAIALSIMATWAVFVWVIARLPRERVSARSAARAALLAAVGFEVFKQLGVFYLQKVTAGPAGAAFGPVIGVLVFFFITSRLILFATAWAATAKENLPKTVTPVPGPVLLAPRVNVSRVPSVRAGLALLGVGAVLGARWRRKR